MTKAEIKKLSDKDIKKAIKENGRAYNRVEKVATAAREVLDLEFERLHDAQDERLREEGAEE